MLGSGRLPTHAQRRFRVPMVLASYGRTVLRPPEGARGGRRAGRSWSPGAQGEKGPVGELGPIQDMCLGPRRLRREATAEPGNRTDELENRTPNVAKTVQWPAQGGLFPPFKEEGELCSWFFIKPGTVFCMFWPPSARTRDGQNEGSEDVT